jgi:hypothetical protein
MTHDDRTAAPALEWHESSGMLVLMRGAIELGRVWGWRASPPWTAHANGRLLGEHFDSIEAARAAVESAVRRDR